MSWHKHLGTTNCNRLEPGLTPIKRLYKTESCIIRLSHYSSASTKCGLIHELSNKCDQQLISAISNGARGKLNGDNLDVYVHTSDVRMENKAKDYHFFASDWSPFRLTDEDIEGNQFLKEYVANASDKRKVIAIYRFKPDTKLFRDEVKTLIARLLVCNMDHFKWIDLVAPSHIDNPINEIMSKPSKSYSLPLILKNETKHADCVEIMDSYEEILSSLYHRTGRKWFIYYCYELVLISHICDDFEKLQIPIGGDQLTRVRLDGAKTLRLGAHTTQEKFDNLYPVIIEMFHTQMDFLEKTVKKFMKTPNGRDQGTLSNMKILIQRSSVNGNVKSRFEAHHEFIQLCGTAYVLEAAMEYFGMESMSSSPTKRVPPLNIHKSHQTKRKVVYDKIMDGFLETIVSPLSTDEDAICEGDIFRVNNIIKLMIPFFFKHSRLSKYMTECIDYILKTEIILPLKYALQVRVASFVNPKGISRKNKAADLQKENQVKVLKEAIKGLGSNKAENLIITISKAGQVTENIVEHLDLDMGHKHIQTTHKTRSEEKDLHIISKLLRQVRPFKMTPGRKLNGYCNIKNSVFHELLPATDKFQAHVLSVADRLNRGIVTYEEYIIDDNFDHEEIVES
ncbi:hypothetical protein ACF0H5_010821 [Mactra antiquata]